MRPVTQSFLNTVRGPHKAVFRARLTYPWATGVVPNTNSSDPLDIISGDVTFDVNSDVNGTLDITLNTPFTYPSAYVHEMYIERGVQYANGTTEYVGLGYFRVNSISQNRIPSGTIRITGEDRMCYIRDARVVAPIQFSAGTSVAAVIDFVVKDVMATVTTVYDTVNWPGGTAAATLLASDHILDQDRLKFLQELVAAYGKICYFDYAGRFVVKDPPSVSGDPVFIINAGKNGVLVDASRTISRDSVYNAVVASGEPVGETPPVYAVARDDNPSSPTWWNGVFGKVPRFFVSSFLTTTAQCQSAAASILANAHGLPYVVDLGMVPNPALEAWDVIRVSYSDSLSETHIIDTITYSLSVEDSMKITTRKQFIS